MELKLLSLTIALTIMALVVSLVMPIADDLAATMAVEQTAEELARRLQSLQQLAVTRDCTFEVVFLREDNCYLVKDLAGSLPVVTEIKLPQGVIWGHLTMQRVRFYANGRPSINGSVTLTHQEWHGSVRVIIAPHSGRIRVERS